MNGWLIFGITWSLLSLPAGMFIGAFLRRAGERYPAAGCCSLVHVPDVELEQNASAELHDDIDEAVADWRTTLDLTGDKERTA